MPVNHIWGIRTTSGDNNQFGPEAEVFGEPDIKDSRIIYGRIMNKACVYGSLVSGNVLIAGDAVVNYSTIFGSATINGDVRLLESSVCDTAVVTDQAVVIRSDVMGNSRVFGNAYVKNARLKDEVIIRGNARLIGDEGSIVEVGGYVFIDRGVWNRAPLHYVCHLSGLVVNESEGDLVNVNCTTNTVKKWLSGAGRRYGTRLGMTSEELDEVQYYVETIAKETGKCY